MVKIHRIWFNTERVDREDHYKITLFSRPRVSIHVDEYIWSFIEENIVKPHANLTRQNTDIFRFPHTTACFGKGSRWTAPTEAISARTLQAAKIGLPGSLPIKYGQTAATRF